MFLPTYLPFNDGECTMLKVSFLQSMSRILPARQWQVKPSIVSLQLALFLHGDALHPAFTGVSQTDPVKAANTQYMYTPF